RAMEAHGVRRLACVSSTAMDHRYDNGGGIMFEKVLKPLIASSIGRTTYTDQRRMETLVSDSHLDWTIVRPSGLFETETVTDYQVTEGFVTGKFTSRLDLADFMLRQLTDSSYVHMAVAIATVSVQPKLAKMLLTEAFHRESRPAAAAR
ncbi:MAG: NAD(P)H-binding protein, partial [Candidatus Dormibacteraeota bacterium]|nr:NAD(P)H-binding protein [Candidatus Dormibacteraeota bacterium]